MLGIYFKGYFVGVNENNLLEIYFLVYMELVGEVFGLFGVKSNMFYFGVIIVFVDFVYDFVLGEGCMINLIIGEYNIFFFCYIFLINF